MFRVGEGQDQIERHRSNSICYSVNPSSMKLFHKDHKETVVGDLIKITEKTWHKIVTCKKVR